jgi:hypothetical protein
MPPELEQEFPDFKEWDCGIDDERFIGFFDEALETISQK